MDVGKEYCFIRNHSFKDGINSHLQIWPPDYSSVTIVSEYPLRDDCFGISGYEYNSNGNMQYFHCSHFVEVDEVLSEISIEEVINQPLEV